MEPRECQIASTPGTSKTTLTVQTAAPVESRQCHTVPFPAFCARPYLVGLQDLKFACGDAIHDFYHVEPQVDCLLDADRQLPVDFIVRCASDALVQDMITKQRPTRHPRLLPRGAVWFAMWRLPVDFIARCASEALVPCAADFVVRCRSLP